MDNTLELKGNEFENNYIKLFTNEPIEILKLCENGDIYVNGRLAETDKDVVSAMREFLQHNGFLDSK